VAGAIELVQDARRWPAIAAMLGRAFGDDPAFSHIFSDPAQRAARLPTLFDLFLRTDAPNGFVMTGANDIGAALWRAPGKAKVSTWTMLRHAPALLGAFGTALPRALALGEAVSAHHPGGRYWYLHVLGCEPSRQGEGIGTALIRAGLARIGRDGLPCCLETATASNVGFYERLGFAVTQEWRVPSGPVLWSMLRPAESRARN
jgi:ribosomal protein S18 acetylase RimI-like enzyme